MRKYQIAQVNMGASMRPPDGSSIAGFMSRVDELKFRVWLASAARPFLSSIVRACGCYFRRSG